MEEFKDVKQIILMSEAEFDRKLDIAFQRFVGKMNQPPEHIGESEALQLLGLRSKTSLWKLRSTGAITYSKMGKIIMYRRSSLLTYIKKHELTQF